MTSLELLGALHLYGREMLRIMAVALALEGGRIRYEDVGRLLPGMDIKVFVGMIEEVCSAIAEEAAKAAKGK